MSEFILWGIVSVALFMLFAATTHYGAERRRSLEEFARRRRPTPARRSVPMVKWDEGTSADDKVERVADLAVRLRELDRHAVQSILADEVGLLRLGVWDVINEKEKP